MYSKLLQNNNYNSQKRKVNSPSRTLIVFVFYIPSNQNSQHIKLSHPPSFHARPALSALNYPVLTPLISRHSPKQVHTAVSIVPYSLAFDTQSQTLRLAYEIILTAICDKFTEASIVLEQKMAPCFQTKRRLFPSYPSTLLTTPLHSFRKQNHTNRHRLPERAYKPPSLGLGFITEPSDRLIH